MKINQKKTVQVDAKVIKIFAKTVDSNNITLVDADGEIICEQEDGYVPGFFPGADGDYIDLEIDVETGQILNWKKPMTAALEEFIEGCKG